MGKRSSGQFPRRKNDAYFTPEKAVKPLLPHLLPGTTFIEPCAGNGQLVRHLEAAGHNCQLLADVVAYDDPHCVIHLWDAATTTYDLPAQCFITNPPWTRKLLYPILENLAGQLPTWLLFDSDWMNNMEAAPYLDYCERYVPVGRVKWIEDTDHQGVDNVAWYRFDKTHRGGPRVFNWRKK